MKPLTRIENFLAKIAGNPAANAEMKPRTRKEYFLNEIAAGSGYDIVVKTAKPLNDASLTVNDLTLEKGSYADVVSKLGKQPITARVYYFSEDESGRYQSEYAIYGIYTDVGYRDAVEISVCPVADPAAVVRKSDDSGTVTLYGATASRVRIIITESGIALG